MMTELKRIVLAEDNPNDVELTLAALGEINLANEVVVVRDGAETLDYLLPAERIRQTGPPGIPRCCCSISRCRKSMASTCCGR